ncbi:MAG: DUF1330 domain-containing protein [Alphaproteobacteria bacterium]|nr:DUF1330 domain-containing protein [Alphaproteobacteria bacterium]
MPAYIIANVTVTDPAAFEAYRKLAQEAIARHRGRYLVRGGATTALEGEPKPARVVVLEFPTVEAAKRFYDSPEYLAARRAREGAARIDMFVVEGYAPA